MGVVLCRSPNGSPGAPSATYITIDMTATSMTVRHRKDWPDMLSASCFEVTELSMFHRSEGTRGPISVGT